MRIVFPVAFVVLPGRNLGTCDVDVPFTPNQFIIPSYRAANLTIHQFSVDGKPQMQGDPVPAELFSQHGPGEKFTYDPCEREVSFDVEWDGQFGDIRPDVDGNFRFIAAVIGQADPEDPRVRAWVERTNHKPDSA